MVLIFVLIEAHGLASCTWRAVCRCLLGLLHDGCSCRLLHRDSGLEGIQAWGGRPPLHIEQFAVVLLAEQVTPIVPHLEPIVHPDPRGCCGGHQVLAIWGPAVDGRVRRLHHTDLLELLAVPKFHLAAQIAEPSQADDVTMRTEEHRVPLSGAKVEEGLALRPKKGGLGRHESVHNHKFVSCGAPLCLIDGPLLGQLHVALHIASCTHVVKVVLSVVTLVAGIHGYMCVHEQCRAQAVPFEVDGLCLVEALLRKRLFQIRNVVDAHKRWLPLYARHESSYANSRTGGDGVLIDALQIDLALDASFKVAGVQQLQLIGC
eukprot:comp21249_c0_seq1/m.28950 comp21249_c0_seq1/g.28950  ORF comp21249_c0_seq1/g.28950 comp21249_c0_seq1/m.28950 type:complete len:318 (+) comp21249_c0_seq1:888-1841(+)